MLYLINVTLLLGTIPSWNNFQLAGILCRDDQGKNSFIVRSNLDDDKSQDIKFPCKPVRSETEFTPSLDKVLLYKGLFFDVIKALFQ